MESLMRIAIITLLSIILSNNIFSQNIHRITLPEVKHTLFDYYTGKERLLSNNKDVTLMLKNVDTSFYICGKILHINDTIANIEYTCKEVCLRYSKDAGSQNFYFDYPQNITLPLDKIEYIEHNTKFSNTMAWTAGLAVFYGLVIAPLTGLPGKGEEHYSIKRYQNNAAVAAGVFVLSYTLYLKFPKTKRYRTSPKKE